MNDSADIKMAAGRLNDSLRSLEAALGPMLEKINRLEKQALEAGDFETDRAALARQLDEAAAREDQHKKLEAEFKQREDEFSALADETTRELDRVIAQVKQALGQNGGA